MCVLLGHMRISRLGVVLFGTHAYVFTGLVCHMLLNLGLLAKQAQQAEL
jgi:hypothetical protein